MRTSGNCPADWLKLDADPPLFASAPWLTSMAARIEGTHQWFLRQPGTEQGIGFFGSVISDGSVSEAKNPWKLLFEPCAMRSLTEAATARQAAARHHGPSLDSWFPSLVLTYPGLECFPAGRGRRSAEALDEAVAAIVAEARADRLGSVAFLYVQPEEKELCGALRRAGLVEFPLVLRANLPLPGRTFSDYLASLSKKGRQAVHRTRQQLADQEVSITSLALSQAGDEVIENLVALRLKHREKYARRPDAEGERSQLQTFRSSFGERVTVHAAMAGTQVISFCLFLDAGAVQHAWMNGTDYSNPQARNTYFEVAYHAPIEDAYHRGIRELSFGYGAEGVKLRRGCRLDEVSAFVLPLSPADLPAARAAAAALRDGLAWAQSLA